MKIIGIIILLILIFAGTIFLQIVLSKKESKWLGLMLPAIFVVLSVIKVLGLPIPPSAAREQTISIIFSIILLYNIPAVLLLSIYFICRKNNKKNKELEKMNIQDIE